MLGAEGRKSPAWLEIKKRATEQAETAALLELGITPDVLASPARQDALVSILPEQDEEPAADDPAVNDEPQSVPDIAPEDEATGESSTAVDAVELPDRGPAAGDSDTLRAFEFSVGPDTTNVPPDALIEREQIPQKWLRLDVDLGALRIDISQGAGTIDRAVGEFNA